MILIFYILAAALIFLSYKSFRGGIDYLNYVQRELTKPPSPFTPFASVILPCKGTDDGLAENLCAVLEQNYPEYEVVFVVDDENDPAVKVIEEVSRKGAKNAERTKLVVAGKVINSSRKVENLREAVRFISDESEVLVFVDSDARPSKNWLKHLVAPLAEENVGAATGYRWFISTQPNLASELRSAWNASIASALGENTRTNFCWGGSTAIRRDVFERLDIREQWRGTLSDDFTVTRAMNAANLAIYFVPQALTASIENNCTLSDLLEFTTRQMKITRVYAPKLWKLSFFGSALFNIVMISALLIIVFSRQNDLNVAVAISTLIAVSAFSAGKSWMRLKAVRLILKDHENAVRRQTFPQLTLWMATPAIFLYNSVVASLSRRLAWRGTNYELVSPNETRILK